MYAGHELLSELQQRRFNDSEGGGGGGQAGEEETDPPLKRSSGNLEIFVHVYVYHFCFDAK